MKKKNLELFLMGPSFGKIVLNFRIDEEIIMKNWKPFIVQHPL